MIRSAIGVDIAKNLICRTPLLTTFVTRQRVHSGYNSAKDAPAYLLGVYRTHATWLMAARGSDLPGADALEIGPGGNVGVTLLMGLAGARNLACIDNIPWAPVETLNDLYRDLIAAAAAEPDTYFVAPAYRARALRDPAGVARELLGKIIYHAPDDISRTRLPDASFDAIFSHACFEHFADPAGAIATITRLLRAGGVTTHQVDLRDHRDFTQPLGHLRYSETIWRMANSHRPHGVRNRWRASEYQARFAANGLSITAFDANQTVTVTDAMRRRFAPHFRRMDLIDLGVISCMLVARKG
jgi:SAM-dependent methyltransferase